MFIEQHQAIHLRELDEWLEREAVVAVGECGLDFFSTRVDEKWQKQLFLEQLLMADNHRLPVIVHALLHWQVVFPTADILDQEAAA